MMNDYGQLRISIHVQIGEVQKRVILFRRYGERQEMIAVAKKFEADNKHVLTTILCAEFQPQADFLF